MGSDPAKSSESSKKISRDPIVSVAKRNRELEKRTHRALSSNVILAVTLAISVVGNVLQGMRQPETKYFIQQADGSGLIPAVPLDKPMGSLAAVTQLAGDAVTSLHSLDFLNYKRDLNGVASYFTKTGWDRYLEEFARQGIDKSLEDQRLVMSAVVTKPPVVLGEGEYWGAKFWDVEVPFAVRYLGKGVDTTVNRIATIKVIRVPATENPKGIAIAQFMARN